MTFSHGDFAQVGKFGLVGIANTLIDFTIFNVLTGGRLRWGKVRANICSTSIAMLFSFFASREAVFTSGNGNPLIQAGLFFAVTAFGLYVLQTGVLYLLVDLWRWPLRLAKHLLTVSGLSRWFSDDFALKNGAKVLGTLVSLTWNFFLYKYVVFR